MTLLIFFFFTYSTTINIARTTVINDCILNCNPGQIIRYFFSTADDSAG